MIVGNALETLTNFKSVCSGNRFVICNEYRMHTERVGANGSDVSLSVLGNSMQHFEMR